MQVTNTIKNFFKFRSKELKLDIKLLKASKKYLHKNITDRYGSRHICTAICHAAHDIRYRPLTEVTQSLDRLKQLVLKGIAPYNSYESYAIAKNLIDASICPTDPYLFEELQELRHAYLDKLIKQLESS